jgi:hypothetical protein
MAEVPFCLAKGRTGELSTRGTVGSESTDRDSRDGARPLRVKARQDAVIPSPGRVRATLFARLDARRDEIEQAVRARVDGISDSTKALDPVYAEGLRAAISAALEHGLAAIEDGERQLPKVPAQLLAQARMAARAGVGLQTVLRRYFAGYTLLGEFLAQEVESVGPADVAVLQSVMRAPAAAFDRLIEAVTEEYARELEDLASSPKHGQEEYVRRLLNGELLDTSEIAYDFDGWHLGLLALGAGAADAIHDLATAVDRRLLFVHNGDGPVWAWLGGRQRLDLADGGRLAGPQWPASAVVAFGEPGQGIAGWRLTHRQAAATLPIAQRDSEGVARYADVALLAAMMHDEVLTASLRELYLAPLEGDRDGGATLRETLRAYFAAERNVSSAAAMLGVSRRTVANRLRAAEGRLGRPLGPIGVEMELALRFQQLFPT